MVSAKVTIHRCAWDTQIRKILHKYLWQMLWSPSSQLKGLSQVEIKIYCSDAVQLHWSNSYFCHILIWLQPNQTHGLEGYERKRLLQVSIYINLVVYSRVSLPSLMLSSNTYTVRIYFLSIPYVLLGGLNCAYFRIQKY